MQLYCLSHKAIGNFWFCNKKGHKAWHKPYACQTAFKEHDHSNSQDEATISCSWHKAIIYVCFHFTQTSIHYQKLFQNLQPKKRYRNNLSHNFSYYTFSYSQTKCSHQEIKERKRKRNLTQFLCNRSIKESKNLMMRSQ